jgi:NAD(P)H-quinone oxidoreductase subunit 5
MHEVSCHDDQFLLAFSAWAPPALMLAAALVLGFSRMTPPRVWTLFQSLSCCRC